MLRSTIAQARSGNLPALLGLLCLSLGRAKTCSCCARAAQQAALMPRSPSERALKQRDPPPTRKKSYFQTPLQGLNALLGSALLGTSPGSTQSGTANICTPEHRPGRGPVGSCHIFTALSQDLYHKLITHTSLHPEIKQVRDGIAACCHETAPSSQHRSMLRGENMLKLRGRGPTHAPSDAAQPDRLREPTSTKPASPPNSWEAQHPSGPTRFPSLTARVSPKGSHISLLRGRETPLRRANAPLGRTELGTSRSGAASLHPARATVLPSGEGGAGGQNNSGCEVSGLLLPPNSSYLT